jgi:hypothetical protein
MATLLHFPTRTYSDNRKMIERGRKLMKENGWGWRMVFRRLQYQEITRLKRESAQFWDRRS